MIQAKLTYGQVFEFYTNLGISIGMISEMEETEKSIVYRGWLEHNEGTFEIIQTETHLAGSIHWSVKVQRDKSFSASYIDKIVRSK